MDPRVVVAARNNAQWCDLVCRAHAIPTTFGRHHWSSHTRAPHLFPDAVTLGPDASVDDVLAQVDHSPGASVKDSFTALDLGRHGYVVLFEGTWIVHVDGAPHGDTTGWSAVTVPDAFAEWVAAHGNDALLPDLLDDPSVRMLVLRRDGVLSAGAVANASGSVVGISNVFGVGMDADAVWTDAAAAVAAAFPGRPVVGYEAGAELAAARGAGFAAIGPMRVWIDAAQQPAPRP